MNIVVDHLPDRGVASKYQQKSMLSGGGLVAAEFLGSNQLFCCGEVLYSLKSVVYSYTLRALLMRPGADSSNSEGVAAAPGNTQFLPQLIACIASLASCFLFDCLIFLIIA